MKKLLKIFCFTSVLIVVTFLLLGDLEGALLEKLQIQENLFTYSIASFLILSSDILLPVPSSLVILSNGKILGFIYGTLLTLISLMLSSIIGYYIGSKLKDKNSTFTRNRLEKVGPFIIAVSKSLPIISESVSITSGASSISLKVYLISSLIGNLAIAILYNYLGSTNQEVNGFIASGIVFSTAIILTAGFNVYRYKTEHKFNLL